MWVRTLFVCLMLVLMAGVGQTHGLLPGTPEYEASLLSDFAERSKLPQTDVPHSQWYTKAELRGWGPMPARYPGVEVLTERLPHGTDIARWKRDRVVAIAKEYIDLPYRHHHIPGWDPKEPDHSGQTGPGLDCSNFTAWVYNFGFGVMLNGDVVVQSKMEARAGYSLPRETRKISAEEGFLPGDLLYILEINRSAVSHVVIYVDEEHIIDSTNGKVAVRKFAGWYRTHLSHGIRIFNGDR